MEQSKLFKDIQEAASEALQKLFKLNTPSGEVIEEALKQGFTFEVKVNHNVYPNNILTFSVKLEYENQGFRLSLRQPNMLISESPLAVSYISWGDLNNVLNAVRPQYKQEKLLEAISYKFYAAALEYAKNVVQELDYYIEKLEFFDMFVNWIDRWSDIEATWEWLSKRSPKPLDRNVFLNNNFLND